MRTVITLRHTTNELFTDRGLAHQLDAALQLMFTPVADKLTVPPYQLASTIRRTLLEAFDGEDVMHVFAAVQVGSREYTVLVRRFHYFSFDEPYQLFVETSDDENREYHMTVDAGTVLVGGAPAEWVAATDPYVSFVRAAFIVQRRRPN